MFERFESWLAKQRQKCSSFSWIHCARPDRTASTDFSFADHPHWAPEARHHSLPKRLLSNFLSERNISYDVEQVFLKQFLKEHGLYNKHQTIQQRRRLKQLLELEQRTAAFHRVKCADNSNVKAQDIEGDRTVLIELHSMPYHGPIPTPNLSGRTATALPVRTIKLRQVASVPNLGAPNEACSSPVGAVTASQPTISWEEYGKNKPKGLRPISWRKSASSDTPSTIETAV